MPEYTEYTIEHEARFQRERLTDLIGHPPGWLLRSGSVLLGGITLLMLTLAWYIRYPDLMEAPVIVTSDHPPLDVITDHTGIIDSIYIRNGDRVDVGQMLVYMSNTATLADIGIWRSWLESMIGSNRPDSLHGPPPPSLALGELHPGYTLISQKYQEWSRWVGDKSVDEKIKAFEAEIGTTRQLMASLQQQIDIYDQELDLQHKSLGRDETLYKDGVISMADREKATSGYLAASRQREALATGLLSHRLRMNQLEALILDQRISYDDQLLTLHTTLRTLCREALTSIAKWDEQYCLRAQIPGIVSIPGQRVSHIHIQAGESLMSIIPEEEGSIYARANVSTAGMGQIEVGDRVILRLEAWPYKQYGTLASRVEEIARVPMAGEQEDKTFEIRMSLSEPVVTTTGVALPLKPLESGTARIITRDRRILERWLDQLLQLTNINP